MRYYDSRKDRLVCIRENPTPDFWDRHWNLDGNIRNDIIGVKHTYVSGVTMHYLTPGSGIILEGGCGKGQHVASLVNNGYRCIGVDSARRTVELINKEIPELDIRYGDVMNLPFEDSYFIGYWSLGVIEHFWEGYDTVASEMYRVLQRGGYLFLSFPSMSTLRKIKAKLGLYRSIDESVPDGFYQFILNADRVLHEFRRLGFQLVDTHSWDGLKGVKDEIGLIKPLLQSLYDYRGESIFVRRCKGTLDSLLSYFAGHNTLLVLVKNSS